LYGAGYVGLVFVDVDVNFAADAEVFQVDAGLDGGAGARDELAHVVSFEAVHVGAVAVDGFADVVAGAMDEIFAEAGFFDVVAGDFVYFPAL